METHPEYSVEAGLIAMSLTYDEDVVVAAILHDIVEDTSFTLEDIEKRFGSRVSQLVAWESEDKMPWEKPEDSWKTRKQIALSELENAPIEAKIICLADKLSNIRLSAETHAEKGDDMWLVFNQKDKKQQEWYYRSIYEVLLELKDTAEYKEYVSLCDEVFGKQEDISLSASARSNSCKVMYDPLIPENCKMSNLPEFVSDELRKIARFFDDNKIAGRLPQPFVFLSNAIYEDSYGKLSNEQLIAKLEEFDNKMPHTEMYEYFHEAIMMMIKNLMIDLSAEEEEPWSEFIPTMTGMERVIELEGTEEDKAILNGLLEILSQRKVERVLRLGEYLPYRHQIIIYYKAIEVAINRVVSPDLDYWSKLSSVLAHEYFHAMHHAMAPGHPLWNNQCTQGVKGFQKKEIIEALADFFSVWWCYEQKRGNYGNVYLDVACERFDSWKKYLYSAWPYSKAIYLMRDDADRRIPAKLDDEAIHTGISSLYPVLDTSIHDIYKSYKLLRG